MTALKDHIIHSFILHFNSGSKAHKTTDNDID